MDKSTLFIVATAAFFAILILYVLVRNTWISRERMKHCGSAFVPNEWILWAFWSWDIRKFKK